jgi:hypothetical protein
MRSYISVYFTQLHLDIKNFLTMELRFETGRSLRLSIHMHIALKKLCVEGEKVIQGRNLFTCRRYKYRMSDICGWKGSKYEGDCLVGCYAVLSRIILPTFQRCLLPPLST